MKAQEDDSVRTDAAHQVSDGSLCQIRGENSQKRVVPANEFQLEEKQQRRYCGTSWQHVDVLICSDKDSKVTFLCLELSGTFGLGLVITSTFHRLT